jgi:hypothetical protein
MSSESRWMGPTVGRRGARTSAEMKLQLVSQSAAMSSSERMAIINAVVPPRWDIEERIASIEARNAEDAERGGSAFSR